MPSKRLYVGNLAYEVSEQDLRTLFEPYGPITDVQLIGGRGFGFVEVPEEKAADAISTLNGTTQWGRGIVVSEARPRQESFSGERRGSGGNSGFRRDSPGGGGGGPRKSGGRSGGRGRHGGGGGGSGGRGGRREGFQRF
ncbi:MAG TPA: RNA-binding protein [bacterium]|nr:RNA-binding protein [bacterium]